MRPRLDIRDHVEFGGEKGLLGFAFAPDFARSGVFFLDYTRGGPLRTEIASFISSGTVADKASEVVILEIAQPFDNHNGGQLAFGPDGYLYMGTGDGGSGGDPGNNAQNLTKMLGKIMRLDVDAPEVPAEVVEKTRQKYREAYQRLTGKEVAS